MTTVLITGAGGVAVPGIIRHLKYDWGYRVLATDMNPYAQGLFCADKGFVVPAGGDPNYLSVMHNICLTEHVDVVVPLVDEELVSALELESDGIRVLLPRHHFTRTCLDKLYLIRDLATAGISVPKTWGAEHYLEWKWFPIIVKPRVGRGSRDVHIFDNAIGLKYFMLHELHNDPATYILQPYIDGAEYTVSVVVWRDGQVQAVVPKEIIHKKGITYMAVTRRNDRIDALCRDIQSKLRADGPFNVQLVVDADSGIPIPFEINPRFSTTTSLTVAAGVDEIGNLIQQAVDPTAPRLTNTWREGVVLLRHMQDEFVSEADFNSHSITDAVC